MARTRQELFHEQGDNEKQSENHAPEPERDRGPMNLEDRLVRDVKEKKAGGDKDRPGQQESEPRMRRSVLGALKRTRVTAENTKAKRPVTICR